jgi:phosphate transport system permease protein
MREIAQDTSVNVKVAPREITTNPRKSDKVFRSIVSTVGMVAFGVLLLIGAFLIFRGFEVFKLEGIKFLTSAEWQVDVDESGNAKYTFGLAAMLIGTILISLTALIVGVPLSVMTAIYINFYAPERLKKALTTVIDLMAAFPSILYGLWGFFVLMPLVIYWSKLLNKYLGWLPIFRVDQPFYERSPFLAGLVLAIMIIPIVTSVTREVFSQAPLDRIQAAYALGATRWSMLKTVVLPFGSNGIVGGAMLGLGRAFGETVAVYSILNIVFKINLDILFGMGGNVASMIVLRWGEATPIETKALLAAGFVLFILTLLVNFLADFVVNRAVKTGKA